MPEDDGLGTEVEVVTLGLDVHGLDDGQLQGVAVAGVGAQHALYLLATLLFNERIVPYYMFVERDTGARRYFEVPLARAWEIYRDAMRRVSGLGRTARGPSMSAGPGKVEVQGVSEIRGEKVFVLRFIQGRNPEWVQQPFFARFDPHATWLDQLQPAFGDSRFFFEDEYAAMCRRSADTVA